MKETAYKKIIVDEIEDVSTILVDSKNERLNIKNHYPSSKFIGLDVNEKAIESCNNLKNVFDLSKMEFVCSLGEDYDYSSVKMMSVCRNG